MVKKSDLPNKMIPFNSNEKNYHQKEDIKDIANFPSPVICILMGNVNTGKTRTLKNILVHKNPPYERIVLYTPLETCTEYDDVDPIEIINEIPELDFFDREMRNCFILEDIDPKNGLSKDEKTLLSRNFCVGASHNNTDIYLISQNPTDISPVLRRVANVIFMWENNDLIQLSHMAKKFNILPQQLKYVFNHICKERTDSFCISDVTSHARYRKNIFEKIEI